MTWAGFRSTADILAECRWLRSELRTSPRSAEIILRRLRVLREWLAYRRQCRAAMRRTA